MHPDIAHRPQVTTTVKETTSTFLFKEEGQGKRRGKEGTFHLYDVIEKPQAMRKISNLCFQHLSQAVGTCLAMKDCFPNFYLK